MKNVMNRNSTVKHFTHNDWDGVSCALLSSSIFVDVDVEYLSYNDVVDRLTEFFENSLNFVRYDFVIISDLSLKLNDNNRNLINDLEDINKVSTYPDVIWIDHHESSDWFLDVQVNQSGTSILYYEYLREFFDENYCSEIDEYVRLVTQYDTFNFKKTGEKAPLIYNYLFKFLGVSDFFDFILPKMINKELIFMHDDYNTGCKYQEKCDNEIKRKMKQVKYFKSEEFTVGVIYNDNYDITSILGNTICENKEKNVDFAMLFYNGGVALRSIGNKFNCAKFAGKYGGGGHFNSAGFKSEFNIEKLFAKEFFDIC